MAPTKLKPAEFIEKYFNEMTNIIVPYFDNDKIFEFYKNNNGNLRYSKETLCKLVMQKLQSERSSILATLQGIYREVAAMAASFDFNIIPEYETEFEPDMDIEIQDEAIIEPFINIRKLENWIDKQCRFSEKEINNRENWDSVFDWFYNDTLTELSYSEFNEYMKDFEKDYLVWSNHVNEVNSKYEHARLNLLAAF